MSVVVGLDLSLTSTGLAVANGGRITTWLNIKSKGRKGATLHETLQRVAGIVGDVDNFITYRDGLIDLAVIEAPSFGSSFGSSHERAHLWWSVVDVLDEWQIPVATVAPATRAKYITGSGRADKKTVLAHATHAYCNDGPFRSIPNDDVADAAGLAAMGARWLGEPVEPFELPAPNLAAMGSVRWPSPER